MEMIDNVTRISDEYPNHVWKWAMVSSWNQPCCVLERSVKKSFDVFEKKKGTDHQEQCLVDWPNSVDWKLDSDNSDKLD